MNRRRFLEATILGAGGTITGLPAFSQGRAFSRGLSLESFDSYLRQEGNRWIMGTSRVEKTIELDHGRIQLTSFKNKISGREYIQNGAVSDEILFMADGHEVSGSDGRWDMVDVSSHRLAQGELQLDLALRHGSLQTVKHYVIYPKTSIIREWLTISNHSFRPIKIVDPGFLECCLFSSDVDRLRLYYMTGGGAYNGSQLLKMEPMSRMYARTFDSYDPSDTGPRGMSYSAHLPLLVLYDSEARDGVMAGWDYLGHWRLKAGNFRGRPVHLSLSVAGYCKSLRSQEEIETPRAFMGAFTDDLDAMGNLLLDWQYQYFWDFTNPAYFAKTRWAVDWPSPWVGTGGTPCADNWGRRLALDLRYVDLMRQAGGDILWDDAGWYDQWGSWNGPDWHLTLEYLAKQGMKWVLWYPTFLATRESRIGQEHPEWLIPKQDVFEQSITVTATWQGELLRKNVKAWGDFQWRYDIAPAVSATDTKYLESDQNFRGLVRRFKEDNIESGVDACFGGGRWISYDLARMAESGEYTDGGVGPYSSYYTSLLIPPDKYHNVSDFDHTFYLTASDRVHLCMDPCWYRDPGDGPDIEAIRKDWEIYHYLGEQGVVGRWSHVFRPVVENDDPIWYFQRMNRDGSKGIIIAKHAKLGPTYYFVSRPQRPAIQDAYYGGPWEMTWITTTNIARADTGIYEDPIDGEYRYYGVPGEVFGPLNFKYKTGSGLASYVTSIWKLGRKRPVERKFFGMAIQLGKQPITITHLGQYVDVNTQGTYTLKVIRAEDGSVLASTDIDLNQGMADAMGFKYAALSRPIQLEPGPGRPIIIKPRGLVPGASYDVQCDKSPLRQQRKGDDLMKRGIEFDSIQPGELVFLNLPNHPGSGMEKTPPDPPRKVTKRLASNLGVQGIEVSWLPGHDNHWISYYEVLREGVPISKVAKGTFFFDYQGNARELLNRRYEVRTVDGDGNRSEIAIAQTIPGEPETYTALGGFSSIQGAGQWRYEESLTDGEFRELRWDSGGYEGRWMGSDPAIIGRIWLQPGAKSDVARTFMVPADGWISVCGSLCKDPSAQNGRKVRALILQNQHQIWPESGWAEISSDFSEKTSYKLEGIRVAAGDMVRFILRHTGYHSPDPVIWNPTVIIKRNS